MFTRPARLRHGRVVLLLLAAMLLTVAAATSAAPAALTIADYNFNDLTRGQILTSYTVNGITMLIDVSGSTTDTATIFDTSVPFPGNAPNPNDFGDPDLGSPNEACVPPGPGESAETPNLAAPGQVGANCTAVGKALIIAENTTDALDNSTMDFDDYLSGSGPADGLIDWPDDESDGGVITLTFEEQSNPGTPIPVTINFLELLDIEPDEASGGLTITFYDDAACTNQIDQQPATGFGDNTFEQFEYNITGVQCVEILFPASGAIPRIVATAGEEELAGLGDYVWFDANGNGIQDDGAANGVNGVTVNLLDDQGNVIDTTVTADDTNGNPGFYSFLDLPPGTYEVEFVLPNGYTGYTTPFNSANTSNDSNADQTTGRSGPVTLAAGQLNPTLDAGLVDDPLAVSLAGLGAGPGTAPLSALAALLLLAVGSAALLRRR